jgi:hypothetical protein
MDRHKTTYRAVYNLVKETIRENDVKTYSGLYINPLIPVIDDKFTYAAFKHYCGYNNGSFTRKKLNNKIRKNRGL